MKKLWVGGEGPSDMPHWAYRHLVTILGADPDVTSKLKCVGRMGFEENVLVYLVRVFDPKRAEETLEVKDFTSLDKHPELILYEGYMEKESGRVYMASRLQR